jgi:glycosyltransferase involved in cell wall biosynthesis
MNIVFDNVLFTLQRAGGGSRFWSKIIRPYIDSGSSLFIERDNCMENLYRKNMKVSPRVSDHTFPSQIARYINFKRQFFRDEFIFHSSYFRVNNGIGCRNVTTVHDLMYEKFRSGIGAAVHLRQKKIALQQSDAIVCVSEHTRQDLFEHYPFCRDKLVSVIPNGVEGFQKTLFLPSFFEHKPKPYFLYVGHRGHCKGFELIHDAIDLLAGELTCVVVGDRFSKVELDRISERGHISNILNVGKVSDEELNRLYSHAMFFFFPSIYEGFGIPPLEAMMSGCPVLASNRSSLPEVVGDAGILFDPSDIDSLKSELLNILQPDVRSKIIELGFNRAAKFGWQPVVNAYAQLYAELLSFKN